MTDERRRARRLRRAALAIRAFGEFGNAKAAAADLGIGEATLRRRIADYCEIYGYDSPIQAVYWLDRSKKNGEIAQFGT